MPRYTKPRRTWHYLNELKVKAVQLSLLNDVQVKDVAATLNRSPSTISREINRNGGYDTYRETQAEQAAWDRAHRPKKYKLACHPMLKHRVATKLKRSAAHK